ncbi:MAG: methionine--tRNA ligase, partial [Candidatus Paceibacterota bacterium]
PKELCDFYVDKFKNIDERLHIDYTHFIRTTNDYHKQEVIKLFNQLRSQGDIYLGSYIGWYNTREETFVSEHDAASFNYLDPVSKLPLQKITEPSYFFKLKKYLPLVLEFLQQNENFIVPSVYHNNICIRLRQYLEGDLEDLSISRTKIQWGIPIPNNDTSSDQHCLYVWMDALLNYHTGPLHKLGNSPFNPNIKLTDKVTDRFESSDKTESTESTQGFERADRTDSTNSNEGFEKQKSRAEVVHVIGKDILWFHAVIWIAFLKALNFNLPRKIYVHDFIVDKYGHKMSKSIGNVIDPTILIKKYGVNAVRFYLVKETTLGIDMKFSEEALAQCVVSELASKLGNLVNRVLSISGKYVQGIIPMNPTSLDSSTSSLTEKTEPYNAHMFYDRILLALNEYRLSDIVEYLQEMIHKTNQHLMKTMIWKIKDKEEFDRVGPPFIKVYLEAILIIGQFFEPILPDISPKIFEALTFEKNNPYMLEPNKFWNQLRSGSKVKTSLILFQLKNNI